MRRSSSRPPLVLSLVVDAGWRPWCAAFLRNLHETPDVDEGALREQVARLGPGLEAAMTTLADRIEARGLEKGRAVGPAETLLKLLRLRFGPLTPAEVARVEAGSEAELDRWTEAVLTASSLAEALG